MKLCDEHREKRKRGFTLFLNSHEYIRQRIMRIGSSQQGDIHDAVKIAYNAGYANGVAQERRSQMPITVGGKN